MRGRRSASSWTTDSPTRPPTDTTPHHGRRSVRTGLGGRRPALAKQEALTDHGGGLPPTVRCAEVNPQPLLLGPEHDHPPPCRCPHYEWMVSWTAPGRRPGGGQAVDGPGRRPGGGQLDVPVDAVQEVVEPAPRCVNATAAEGDRRGGGALERCDHDDAARRSGQRPRRRLPPCQVSRSSRRWQPTGGQRGVSCPVRWTGSGPCWQATAHGPGNRPASAVAALWPAPAAPGRAASEPARPPTGDVGPLPVRQPHPRHDIHTGLPGDRGSRHRAAQRRCFNGRVDGDTEVSRSTCRKRRDEAADARRAAMSHGRPSVPSLIGERGGAGLARERARTGRERHGRIVSAAPRAGRAAAAADPRGEGVAASQAGPVPSSCLAPGLRTSAPRAERVPRFPGRHQPITVCVRSR